MNTFVTLLRKAAVGISMAGLLVSQALALPVVAPSVPSAPDTVVHVQSNCHAVGQQQAAQVGGQLARATVENRGGRQVCVIVVLIPGSDGQRPRRSEIVVPMG